MKILIDNGHGRETAGKRSPDGRLLEWAYTRNPPHGGAGFHWTDIDENAPGFWAKGITLIRANFVKKTMHFARYRNKSAIVMVSLAMSEYPFRERP